MKTPPKPDLDILGFKVFEGFFPLDQQEDLVGQLRQVAKGAPFRQPVTPSGKPLSVRMSAAGDVGWQTDRSGYRYAAAQADGSDWPAIPRLALQSWRALSGADRDPDSCLINYYGEGARLGLHQDRDERELDWPVVSISLGDEALFRMGGPERRDKTKSVWLRSGDVVVMSGAARLAYHGVDRIKFGTSPLLSNGGRLNVTLRVAQ